MDLINFIGCSPFTRNASTFKTRKYDAGGPILNPTLIAKRPLKHKQMKQLSNNWENGVQGYQLNGYYYNSSGEPISKNEYDYYYNPDGRPIEAITSSIRGELNTNTKPNNVADDFGNTTSDFTHVNTMNNGQTRTIRSLIGNTQGVDPKSYVITYDVDNPNLFFTAQGMPIADAKKLVFNK